MGNGSKDDPEGGAGDQKIKVGDKEYSAADVQNLLTQASSNAEKVTAAQKVIDAAARYDMTPDEFTQQSIGALGVVSELITKGVVDETGKLIEKKTPQDKKDKDDLEGLTEDEKLMAKLFGESGGKEGLSKVNVLVEKAMGSYASKQDEKFDQLLGKLQGIEKLQSSMIRSGYEEKIQKRFPNLDSDDVAKVFGTAMNDKSKGLWQHAEAASKEKHEREVEIARREFKKRGLDYDQMIADENALNEMGPEGGGAALLTKGKQISFRKSGEGYISPLEATKRFFKLKGM